jgi:hypothetical protein
VGGWGWGGWVGWGDRHGAVGVCKSRQGWSKHSRFRSSSTSPTACQAGGCCCYRKQAMPDGQAPNRGAGAVTPALTRSNQAADTAQSLALLLLCNPLCAPPPPPLRPLSSSSPCPPCSSSCVMVKRSPARQEAVMTRVNPTRWNCASPATSSSRPPVMMDTTPARRQLGLGGRGGGGGGGGRSRGRTVMAKEGMWMGGCLGACGVGRRCHEQEGGWAADSHS